MLGHLMPRDETLLYHTVFFFGICLVFVDVLPCFLGCALLLFCLLLLLMMLVLRSLLLMLLPQLLRFVHGSCLNDFKFHKI